MRKNPHGRILKGEPKEQHLSTVKKDLKENLYDIYLKCHYSFLFSFILWNVPPLSL